MNFIKTIIPTLCLGLCLANCGAQTDKNQTAAPAESEVKTDVKDSHQLLRNEVEVLKWQDLMPAGEEELLAELYTDFYEEQERLYRQQMTLSEAASQVANAEDDIMSLIGEGSAQDTMEQIGTYNVVEALNGANIRLPGYVVPLDFNADSEYDEFLLVPYFGACLHTPPPPPNQIVFVKSASLTKIVDLYEPVWVEGVMKTGQFGTDLGNSAYELTLAKLEPYEY